MCTANYQAADSNMSYAKSKDGQAEISSGANAINQGFQAWGQSSVQNSYLKAQEAAFMMSANALELKARDTIEGGRDANAWRGVQSNMEIGRAKNQLSYSGIDIGYGSAKSYLDGLKKMTEIDKQTTRYNAMNAAFGFESAALNARQRAESSKASKTNPWLTAFAAAGSSLYSSNQKMDKGSK